MREEARGEKEEEKKRHAKTEKGTSKGKSEKRIKIKEQQQKKVRHEPSSEEKQK